jgi:hypothetical protein
MKRGLFMVLCGWLAVAAMGCGDEKVVPATKNYPPPSGEESESTGGGKGKVKSKGENAKEG